MLRYIYRFVVILFVLQSPIATAQLSLANIGDWMARYYQDPKPDAIPDVIIQSIGAGVFQRESARLNMMMFASKVLEQDPTKARQWCRQLSFLANSDRRDIAWIVWNAKVPDAEKLIREELELSIDEIRTIAERGHYDPLAQQATTVSDIDMLWVTFMATGSADAVNRIIDLLAQPLPQESEPQFLTANIVRTSAQWSLESNIRQHQRVADIANQRLKGAKPPLKQELQQIINQAAEDK